jgi:glycosyltransferase involved in cell wall biosynthesis
VLLFGCAGSDAWPFTISHSQFAVLPVSVVIPTRNRAALIGQTLDALLAQVEPPAEIIVVDASTGDEAELTRYAVSQRGAAYHTATTTGAAPQRNQGVANAIHETILFLDDDIQMTPDCLGKLYAALMGDERIGGISLLLHGGVYRRPGVVSRLLFAFINGGFQENYAGRCLGPGLTTPPSDDPSLPELVPVDWLITGCVLYRRAALPTPPFQPMFVGPSIAEDLALSLTVGKSWTLLNARTVRAFHISDPHHHTAEAAAAISEMEFINRHYIATQILGRRSWLDTIRFLAISFLFLPSTLLQPDGVRLFPARMLGRVRGLLHVFGSP